MNAFLKELQKRGIEAMLEGEMDAHLAMRSMNSPRRRTRVMAMVKRP